MLIAIDAEMMYKDGIRYPGNIELVNNLFHIDFKNKIVVLAETEEDAKRICNMLDIDGFTTAAQRSGFTDKTDLYICKKDAMTKRNVKVELRSS